MSNHTTFAVPENAGPAFSPTQPAPGLAVLVPTRNEAANIQELLRRLSAAVTGIPTEIVFVDDSDDNTPDVIRDLARRSDGACRVSLIHRRGDQRTGGLGGAVADGLGPARALISAACGSAAKLLFPLRLGDVTDPMSGFFLLRRSAVRLDELRPRGFKILLELLVRRGGLRATEIPYTFADRHAGQSKGTLREGLTYLGSLANLRLSGRA